MALQQSNSSKQLDGPAKGMGKVAMAASLINNSNNSNINNNNNNNNGRKALGDIGNLVVLQQQQLNAKGKDGVIQPQDNPAMSKKAVVTDRPITRSYGAQLAATDEELVPTAADKLGVNVYRRKPNPKLHLPPPAPLANHEKSSSTDESSDSASARVKTQLSNNNIRKAVLAARERRGKTLTATLTARSEAACGGFDVKKVVKAAEAVRDIDEGDIGNQLAVVDYVEDIYSFYRKTEVQSCVAADYMTRQSDISEKMRAILVDWLVEVHLKFKLMPETLFLTTNLLDRYLSVKSVTRKNLQLVGMTALLLAAKYEEIWAPEIKDFEFISDHAYSREEILDMEKVMLNTLRFNLTVPTPYVFLVRNLKAASFSHDQQQMDMLAFFLVELCLVDYKTMKFSPSMLAAAAVYIAQCYSTTISKLASAMECDYGTPLRLHCAATRRMCKADGRAAQKCKPRQADCGAQKVLTS